MNKYILIVLVGIFMTVVRITYADDADEFKSHNPNGQKFEFVRSYVTSLGYFNKILIRWQTENPREKYKGDQKKMMQAYMDYLALDNSELRVAKNYLTKYLSSPNAMMRKVTDMYLSLCETQIDFNIKERGLWQDFIKGKSAQPDQAASLEKEFVAKQQQLVYERKENFKDLIVVSVLVSKVLMHEDAEKEKSHQLAVTAKQREKLIAKLDDFARDNLDWGVKSGQTVLQASVAAIREVLEDPLWKSLE